MGRRHLIVLRLRRGVMRGVVLRDARDAFDSAVGAGKHCGMKCLRAEPGLSAGFASESNSAFGAVS